MKLDAAAWEKWTRWIGSIKSDLSATVSDRAQFQAFRKVVDENAAWIAQNHGNGFYGFVVRCYVARTALGVRRHTKKDKDSISLARLLGEVSSCATQISFDEYLKRFPLDPEDVNWQTSAFRELSIDGDVVSAKVVSRDLEELQQTAALTEKFADRVLAHLDPKGFGDTLTFASMHDAVGRFDRLACRYVAFLGGNGYSTLERVMQYDWERIFSVPFKKPC